MKGNISRTKLFGIMRIGMAAAVFATPAWAQGQRPQTSQYTLTDLGVVGSGQPIHLTDNGLISGASSVADGTEHAFLWYKRLKVDIGKPGLGGPNSISFGVNQWRQAVGQADTSTAEPNGEDFCGFKSLGLPSAGTTCLPFLWQNGTMTALPTLDGNKGNNGVANAINNLGVIAGSAENTTRDSTCPAYDPTTGQFQVMESKPVTWENGSVQELPTVGMDPDGNALAINDNGQVVGASGICSTFNPQLLVSFQPIHALLWKNGTPTDLGSLGGTGHGFGNVALGVNNLGQVVGASDLGGDTASHGFLWTKETGMQDLGALAGDFLSSAIGINDSGQIVGVSLGANFGLRAVVWENGAPIELNTLVPPHSSLYLLLACSINSSGHIIGFGVTRTGEVHGYVATPIGSQSATGGAQTAAGEDAKLVLPENVRKQLRKRLR